MPVRKNLTHEYLLAQGSLTGQQHYHVSGINRDVDTGTDPETIWTEGGLYAWDTFTTGGIKLNAISTSGSDEGDLIIEGLDGDWNLQTETVVMTGTVAKQTQNNFSRVNRITYVGDSANAGNILLRSLGGTTLAKIETGAGKSKAAIFTVPYGYKGYLLAVGGGVSVSDGFVLTINHRPIGDDSTIGGLNFQTDHSQYIQASTYSYHFPVPIAFDETTDIELRAEDVSADDTLVTGSFDIVLIQD